MLMLMKYYHNDKELNKIRRKALEEKLAGETGKTHAAAAGGNNYRC